MYLTFDLACCLQWTVLVQTWCSSLEQERHTCWKSCLGKLLSLPCNLEVSLPQPHSPALAGGVDYCTLSAKGCSVLPTLVRGGRPNYLAALLTTSSTGLITSETLVLNTACVSLGRILVWEWDPLTSSPDPVFLILLFMWPLYSITLLIHTKYLMVVLWNNRHRKETIAS